jgi:hypothetical protein
LKEIAVSEMKQSDDRMSESDWTHIGPEESEVKRRSDELMPEGIEEAEWAKGSQAIRSIVLTGMCWKSLRRRSGLSSKSR